MKPWRVVDTLNGVEEDFLTEAEALAFAEETLAMYRAEAACDGEWPDEIEHLRVYRLAHSAQVVEAGVVEIGDGVSDYAEYGICPVP